jgi:glutamate racemase
MVVFLDSGIGSLPYAAFFAARNREDVISVADREHFPYGGKSKDALRAIVLSLAERIVRSLNPRLIAVACNTASVSALTLLREALPIPFVGTVPAVKPAVLASKKRRVAVLATERTIDDPYIADLAVEYGADCRIIGIAAPGLVEFVERKFVSSSADERSLEVGRWVKRCADADVDGIVLACTHFLLLLDEFREIAAEYGITVYDSVEGVARRAESLLASLGGEAGCGTRRLLVTGKTPLEPDFARIAERFGFTAGLFE